MAKRNGRRSDKREECERGTLSRGHGVNPHTPNRYRVNLIKNHKKPSIYKGLKHFCLYRRLSTSVSNFEYKCIEKKVTKVLTHKLQLVIVLNNWENKCIEIKSTLDTRNHIKEGETFRFDYHKEAEVCWLQELS